MYDYHFTTIGRLRIVEQRGDSSCTRRRPAAFASEGRLFERRDRPAAAPEEPDRRWVSRVKSDDVIADVFEYVPIEKSIYDQERQLMKATPDTIARKAGERW